MIQKPFLITGHPRCGTGYMAQLFQNFGYYVGHEYMLEDGISSWLFATDGYQPWVEYLTRQDYTFDYIICAVRNPIRAIASIAYTENLTLTPTGQYQYNHPSLEYRQHYINLPPMQKIGESVRAAVVSYVKWYQLILRQEPHVIIQIERAPQQLYQWFNQIGLDSPETVELPDKTTNSRAHPPLSQQQIQKYTPAWEWQQLEQLAQQFGYSL